MTFDHSDATRVLEALQEDHEVWTADQKKRIGAAVQLTLSGLANVASDATRTCTKEQECLKVYRYFPQKLWAVCKSGETIKK